MRRAGNCGVGTAALQQMGIRIRRMVRNMVCPLPECGQRIGDAEYEYFEKSIWHKACSAKERTRRDARAD